MNWKVTRPNQWIRFDRGEPICMVVPYPRGFCESLTPQTVPMAADPETHARYKAWEAGRKDFIKGLHDLDPETVKRGWQKDYFQGKSPVGQFEAHQTRLALKPFPPPPAPKP